LSEIKNNIGYFTANFRDGQVNVGGESFPVGFFFMNAMNEYWKPYSGNDSENFEIAQKLLVICLWLLFASKAAVPARFLPSGAVNSNWVVTLPS
jgi:hypothetical protein